MNKWNLDVLMPAERASFEGLAPAAVSLEGLWSVTNEADDRDQGFN